MIGKSVCLWLISNQMLNIYISLPTTVSYRSTSHSNRDYSPEKYQNWGNCDIDALYLYACFNDWNLIQTTDAIYMKLEIASLSLISWTFQLFKFSSRHLKFIMMLSRSPFLSRFFAYIFVFNTLRPCSKVMGMLFVMSKVNVVFSFNVLTWTFAWAW